MGKSTKYWLIAIFLLTLSLRLYLAFSIPNFTYESYFHLRQVDNIINTGMPLYYDELSYGGRELLFPPFFHYFAAIFALILPLELVAKILPNLLIASMPFIVYLISKNLTNNDTAALFSAFISGLIPILFTVNSFTANSLFLPLIFLAIYSFIKIKDKKYLYLYLSTFIVLSFTSSATFLILVGFIIYLLLSFIENKKVNETERDAIIFSFFFYAWSQLLFFKEVLIKEGIGFIWQNVPPSIIQQYFPNTPLFQALVLVSIIPLLAGIYMVYKSLFKIKNQKAFLIISLAISTTLLTWLRLISYKISLVFFGVVLAILFSLFYNDLIEYLKKTKLAKFRKIMIITLILILIITIAPSSISVAFQQDVPSNEDLQIFLWLRDNIGENSTILALLEEGHLITYISKKKNFMDDQFYLIPNVQEKFNDLNLIFTTSFQTQAINLLNKNNIDYIVLTKRAKDEHDLTRFKYIDPSCFERVHKGEVKVYKVRCTIEETS